MTKNSDFYKRISHFFLLALFSGILVGTSYIPFSGWALLFGFIPLWFAALKAEQQSKPLRKVFFAGWLTQFTLTLIGFNWIYFVSSEFGHLPWSLSLGALLLFAAFMHLYIPFSLVLGSWLFKKFQIQSVFKKFFIWALLLALLERIWPSIFEWNMAYTLLWIKSPLYQWADVVGFWGLSTWLLLFQAGLASALYFYRSNKKMAYLTGAGVLLLVLALSLTGGWHAQKWKATNTDPVLKVAVAQGNIGNDEKLQSELRYQYHSYIRGLYTQLSSAHLLQDPADVIIWPETAMPFALDEYTHQRTEQKALLQSIQEWRTPVITGAYSVNPNKRDLLGYPLARNAVFYLSPELNFLAAPYYKTNLLAFGEYMPFGETFPILYKLLPFVGVYEKGSGPITAQLKLKNQVLTFGPQICYDSLVPGFSRGLAINGAQIIFNVTNDSWFGWWAEPFQHGWMTLARAIEVRRPLIRSTNTGISATILADGELLETSPINKTWTHTFNIPYKQNPEQTFYTKWGHYDWVLWLLVLIGLILFNNKKGQYVRS